jgi:hypothetical protein
MCIDLVSVLMAFAFRCSILQEIRCATGDACHSRSRESTTDEGHVGCHPLAIVPDGLSQAAGMFPPMRPIIRTAEE